jgi:hypothetical protein
LAGTIANGTVLKRSSKDDNLSRQIHTKSVLEILVLVTASLSVKGIPDNELSETQPLSEFNLTGQPYLNGKRWHERVVELHDLSANLTLRVVRDANATRLRNPFKASSDVDAVAKDIVVIDDNVLACG